VAVLDAHPYFRDFGFAVCFCGRFAQVRDSRGCPTCGYVPPGYRPDPLAWLHESNRLARAVAAKRRRSARMRRMRRMRRARAR
jgi:hypothetical protein